MSSRKVKPPIVIFSLVNLKRKSALEPTKSWFLLLSCIALVHFADGGGLLQPYNQLFVRYNQLQLQGLPIVLTGVK